MVPVARTGEVGRGLRRSCAIAAILVATPAMAQTTPPPDASTALTSAKELFRQGVTLFNAGDVEHALDYFLRSRAAFPSGKNTVNAAICLDRLGRYDEALELYEEILTKFGAELDAASRADIGPAMAALRGKVGSIDISANVAGAILIDGRGRGKLPLTSPVRVLAGKHVVRVLKDGYVTAEVPVVVQIGETAKVDAKLEPLAQAGLLRVEDLTLAGAEVFVDRVSVGKAPWEGTLGPGRHVIWTRSGDVGSAPTAATVVQGQTVVVQVKSAALGAPTRIDVAPPSADLIVDGVELGPGAWDGRLPAGAHAATAREAGYFERTLPFDSPPVGSSPVSLRLALAIDPNHPRWPKATSGHLWVEAFAGYALGPSMHTGAESNCTSCPSNPGAGGPLAGGRVGYRFPFGTSIELGGGYLSLVSSFQRTIATTYGSSYPIRYSLDDEVHVRGPFVVAGVSHRVPLGDSFDLSPRVSAGILFSQAFDVLSASAATNGAGVSASVDNTASTSSAIDVVVVPELALGWRIGSFRVGAALAGLLLPTNGPTIANGQLTPPYQCPAGASPATVGCAKGSGAVQNERSHGTMLLFMPQLSAGYTF